MATSSVHPSLVIRASLSYTPSQFQSSDDIDSSLNKASPCVPNEFSSKMYPLRSSLYVSSPIQMWSS